MLENIGHKFLENLLQPLVVLGFIGQIVFAGRFIVQWIASERRRRSYVPVVFWWISLAGGTITLLYAVLKGEPVFALGQASGLVVYVRNLVLIYRRHRSVLQAPTGDGSGASQGQ